MSAWVDPMADLRWLILGRIWLPFAGLAAHGACSLPGFLYAEPVCCLLGIRQQ